MTWEIMIHIRFYDFQSMTLMLVIANLIAMLLMMVGCRISAPTSRKHETRVNKAPLQRYAMHHDASLKKSAGCSLHPAKTNVACDLHLKHGGILVQ